MTTMVVSILRIVHMIDIDNIHMVWLSSWVWTQRWPTHHTWVLVVIMIYHSRRNSQRRPVRTRTLVLWNLLLWWWRWWLLLHRLLLHFARGVAGRTLAHGDHMTSHRNSRVDWGWWGGWSVLVFHELPGAPTLLLVVLHRSPRGPTRSHPHVQAVIRGKSGIQWLATLAVVVVAIMVDWVPRVTTRIWCCPIHWCCGCLVVTVIRCPVPYIRNVWVGEVGRHPVVVRRGGGKRRKRCWIQLSLSLCVPCRPRNIFFCRKL